MKSTLHQEVSKFVKEQLILILIVIFGSVFELSDSLDKVEKKKPSIEVIDS